MTKMKTTTKTSIAIGVYGTLKKGFSRHSVLLQDPEFKYLGNKKFPGYEMYNVHDMYPAIVPSDDKTKTVEMEIYRISAEMLLLLDQVEGTPFLYTRHFFKDKHTTVYFYVFNLPTTELERIEKW